MSNVNDIVSALESFDILVDLPFTLAKVKQLKQIATELEDTDKKIQKQIKLIESSWKGNSAEAMKDRLSQANSVNKMLVDDLNQVADRIKSVVEGIADADNASVQRIQGMGK